VSPTYVTDVHRFDIQRYSQTVYQALARTLNLYNADEIFDLEVTCAEAHAYWIVTVTTNVLVPLLTKFKRD